MNTEKQRAVLFLVFAATSLTLMSRAAAAHPGPVPVAPGRSVAFPLLASCVGLVLSGLCWAWVRKVKSPRPGQSWPEFLRQVVIGVLVLVFVGVWDHLGNSLLPVLDDLLNLLHDFETVRFLVH
jgi:hypothetical protein